MFFKSIHKRIRIVLLIIVMLFVVVVLKVGYIQLFEYSKLNDLATDLWSRNLPIWSTVMNQVLLSMLQLPKTIPN